MAVFSNKIQNRLISGIKKFQLVLNNAKTKDINEADTVLIVTDILSELLGYDKYSDITSEYSIKKTFCDIAIKIESKVRFLIEVKAIGLELKDDYVKQAIDYGANLGTEWVILTNGYLWKVYKIFFTKPINKELVYDFNLLNIDIKNSLDLLYFLCKESIGKSFLEEYHLQKQTLNRFFIGQIILQDPVIDMTRRLIKKCSPEVKITNEQIREVLLSEVLKREILEGDKFEEAKKKISKIFKLKKEIIKEKSEEPQDVKENTQVLHEVNKEN